MIASCCQSIRWCTAASHGTVYMSALSYVHTHSLSQNSWRYMRKSERAWAYLRYLCVLNCVYVVPLCLCRRLESCHLGAHCPSSLSSVTVPWSCTVSGAMFVWLRVWCLSVWVYITHDSPPLLSRGHINSLVLSEFTKKESVCVCVGEETTTLLSQRCLTI